MSIDWITVAAQIVNFLVLIWLLKRFLYRPILDGIDAREKEIAERMGEAERIRAAAEAAKAEFEARSGKLHAGREDVLEAARQAAEAERSTLLTEARERLASERAALAGQRAEEARRYSEELHREGARALLSLTRKALKDLADGALEARIVAQAEGDSSRFLAVLDEYQKAPRVTRDRMYIDALEQVYSGASKVLIDSDSGNSLMYLPLDKLMSQSGASASRSSSTSSVGSLAAAPTTCTLSARSSSRGASRKEGESWLPPMTTTWRQPVAATRHRNR